MKTTQISQDSWQLTKLGLVNCYLVRESEELTLIDTGIGGSADSILAAATVIGSPIRRILLTHAHGDHVGSVDALMVEILAQQKVAAGLAASARSIPLLQKPPDKSTLPGEPADKIKGSLPGIAAKVTHTLAEGELYGSLRVIETPGHIPGHLSFLDERDGTLFVGDALVCVGHVTVSGYAPWYFPLPNLATWSRDLALDSAKKLLDYPIHRFAAGHGAIREGGMASLQQAIVSVS
jgi:glyoxylase-like metal-dependent hydrolase (beta-lactamase superfamily II)